MKEPLKQNIKYLGITLLTAGALQLSACGGGNDGPRAPVLRQDSSIMGVSSFNQNVAAQDGETEDGGPGQANYWDIENDFSLDDGGDDQFDDALEISISSNGGVTFTGFPSDVSETELMFYGPELGSAAGVITASVSDNDITNGLFTAHLHGTHDSRLQQTLDLSGALTPLSLTWAGNVDNGQRELSDTTFYYRVVLRDTGGALLATLYNEDQTGTTGTFGSADISAFAGQTVVLAFEARAYGETSRIDDVSVNDGATEYVSNGDFETGDLSGWTANDLVTSQNISMGVRVLEGIEVVRSFYTVPNNSWGRWVDVYTNPDAADANITIRYNSNLGSDGAGIIYFTPGSNNRGLSSWDGDNSDRDVGFAFGNADLVEFLSDDGIGNSNGDDDIDVSYNVTIPAGGSIAIVNFIVMNGIDTADTATDINARATEIDNEVNAIINGYGRDGQYQDGMTQAQIDAVINM